MLKISPNLSLYMLINVMLIKKKACTSNSFVALPRLLATAVDYAHELISGEPGISSGWVAKNGIIHQRGVRPIRNSRV